MLSAAIVADCDIGESGTVSPPVGVVVGTAVDGIKGVTEFCMLLINKLKSCGFNVLRSAGLMAVDDGTDPGAFKGEVAESGP